MVLPNYQEVIKSNTKGGTSRQLIFDKLNVSIYSEAKHEKTELFYHIKPGCEQTDINLSMYITTVNDYLISHPYYGIYKEKATNLFDFSCIKFITFRELKFDSNEFQIINHCYPNICLVQTMNCIIYNKASIGCLRCSYSDTKSTIMSLNQLNGFSGDTLRLSGTKIPNKNHHTLNLLCDILTLEDIDLDYESFFLKTDAPKMRKLEILHSKEKDFLRTTDLLFISGFYNLEYIDINGVIDNYDSLQKLERLRKIRNLVQSDESQLEMVKKRRMKFFKELKNRQTSEERIRHSLMVQGMEIENNHLEFLSKLYTPRLERVKWENKIVTNDSNRIQKELLAISNMPRENRKNISRERKEYTFFDYIHGLAFDQVSNNDDEYVLVDSRPVKIFGDSEREGIKYYVKSKKIVIDK